MKLIKAASPVLCRHAPESRKTECRCGIFQGKVCLAISLSLKREYRVRPRLDSAADPPREVHAQERKCGIRHRIDQASNKFPARRRDFVIFTPKRHDDRVKPRSRG